MVWSQIQMDYQVCPLTTARLSNTDLNISKKDIARMNWYEYSKNDNIYPSSKFSLWKLSTYFIDLLISSILLFNKYFWGHKVTDK